MQMKITLSLMLAPMLLAAPVAAQLTVPPSEEAVPSRLAPLDANSPWEPRFDEAARALATELARGSKGDWAAMFGGHWLSAVDRARIAAALDNEAGTFRRSFAGPAAHEYVILGWQPAGGDAAYAALADRPEGDAIICWRPAKSTTAWPQTAAEAEDVGAHACVRVSYSVRFDPPMWRAFMDAPVAAVSGN